MTQEVVPSLHGYPVQVLGIITASAKSGTGACSMNENADDRLQRDFNALFFQKENCASPDLPLELYTVCLENWHFL